MKIYEYEGPQATSVCYSAQDKSVVMVTGSGWENESLMHVFL
jgi:hypothetical protein